MGDTTGEFASLGQSGPVWFLAGTFGSTVTRTVTIPAGKTLFFPILNTIWINIPELGDNPWSDAQRAYARTVIAPFIDAGKPVFSAEYAARFINLPVVRNQMCAESLNLGLRTLVLPVDLDDSFRFSCDP